MTPGARRRAAHPGGHYRGRAGSGSASDHPSGSGTISTTAIRLDQITKRFEGTTEPAVDNLTLDVPRGSVVSLIGPSGCGKTTTLRIINRLIEPTSGSIEIDGEDVTARPVAELRRDIGYVIQQVGLFPHRTVSQNIATVPKTLGWDKARTQDRIDGRSVLVTHDLDEALKLSDRIALLNIGGIIEQYAEPDDLLRAPANECVERFAGDDRGVKRLQLSTVSRMPYHQEPVVDVSDDMDEARAVMEAHDSSWVGVLEDDRFLGWIRRDDLDLIVDYIGGSQAELLPDEDPSDDPATVVETITPAYDEIGADVLDYSEAVDGDAFVVRGDQEGETISDIADAGLVLGASAQCFERPQCFIGFEDPDVYGIEFADTATIEFGPLPGEALTAGEVDAVVWNTTAPQIDVEGFKVLEDDRACSRPRTSPRSSPRRCSRPTATSWPTT